MENLPSILSKEDLEKEFSKLLLNSSPSDKLALFFNLQEQRSSINNKFNDGFKKYLVNKDTVEYEKSCESVSQQISNLSKEIIQIENSLSSDNPKWSSIIKDIRDYEKQKFILTTQYQVIQTELNESIDVLKENTGVDFKNNVDEKGNSVESNTNNCLSEYIDNCEQQIGQFKSEINKCIEKINEKLEELKYELNDSLSSEDQSQQPQQTHTCSHGGEHHHTH
eukprot:gene3291-4123_t